MRFVSDDRPSSGKKLGLNTAYMTKFQYNPAGGAQGAAADCIDIEFLIEGTDKPINYRKYDNTKVYDFAEKKSYSKDDLERLRKAKKDDEVKKVEAFFLAKDEELVQTLVHIVKAYVDEEEIIEALKEDVNFPELVKILMNLLPKNFEKIPVHLFLQYQYSVKSGQNKTWLEVPNNVKSGKFISPFIEGNWKEIRDDKGLYYEDENGNKHPFNRSTKWLAGKTAYQQDLTIIVDDSVENKPAFM